MIFGHGCHSKGKINVLNLKCITILRIIKIKIHKAIPSKHFPKPLKIQISRNMVFNQQDGYASLKKKENIQTWDINTRVSS